jgi:GH25 family lysozyme M1 (1,4-beta-N-acetylmuramidase)
VSKYQHPAGKPIDWASVKRAGQSFAFIKASGGSDRTDPWFAREWAAAGKAGLIRGAYHYADPSKDAETQAAYVVGVVGSTREANDLGIVLDLETTGGLSPSALSRWAHTFLAGVERRTGRVPILYTYPNFWHTRMKDDRTFGAYPLWLANYADRAPAPLPGWDRWTFWQHTSSYHLPGIPGRVDHDVMCCSAGTLAALADGRSVAITRAWSALGGASGQLGLPLGTEVAVTGGWAQTFEKGFVSTSEQGTWAVLGSVYDRYRETGGATGPLGLPVAAQESFPGGVVLQRFAGGVLVGTAGQPVRMVRGDVLARWLGDGGPASKEGLPLAEATDVVQQFAGGGLYRTPGGVRLVPGAIRDRYEELGGPGSTFGLPLGEAYPSFGGTAVDFQLGQLIEVTIAGQTVVV